MSWEALYYPDCELPNDNWLLSAILYWDKISYLVPVEEKDVKRPSAIQQLTDERIVVPRIIDPSMKEVKEATKKFVTAKNVREIRKFLAYDFRLGHKESGKTVEMSRPMGKSGARAITVMKDLSKTIVGSWSGGKSHINLNVFRMYMLVLANEYREQNNMSLITNTSLKYFAGNAAGEALASKPQEGVLAHLILNNIGIQEGTKLKNVLTFKDKHHDELLKFRLAIEKIQNELKDSISTEAVVTKIDEINLEIKESELDLRSKLKANNIKTFTQAMGISIPTAIAATTIVSPATVMVAAVPLLIRATEGLFEQWDLEKNAPYSYVLAARRNLVKGQIKYSSR